jgi:hypothetical protein
VSPRPSRLDSLRAGFYEAPMSLRPRKPSNANPRATAFPLLACVSAQILGFVDAPDRASAEVAAAKAFNLDAEQRSRLVVQERG